MGAVHVTARPDAARPRPRPTPDGDGGRRRHPSRPTGRGLALPEAAQTGQVVAAAGNAIVTGAKLGRILGRSAWRIAKQVPGVVAVEQQAQRLRGLAAAELARLLEVPQLRTGTATEEEQRAMLLVMGSAGDPEPLRSAMSELLERSAGAVDGRSREYLFGTIVSQLVPDEARILAVLAERSEPFPAVDVLAKHVGRSTSRTVLANVSTVGAAAGVVVPVDTPTYLGRLHAFGLVEFGPATERLETAYKLLAEDPAVAAARARVEAGKLGSARVVRKTISLSPLGREFWTACAPRSH